MERYGETIRPLKPQAPASQAATTHQLADQTTPVRGPGVTQTIRPQKPLKPQAATTQQLTEIRAQAAASQAAATQQLSKVQAQAAASQAATTQQLSEVRAQATANQAATTQQLSEVRAQAAANQAATTQQLSEVRAQATVNQAATTQQLSEVRAQAAASQAATTQQLKQVRKHLQEMSGKLQQLTIIPTKTQWTLLSTSMELLSARQEIMMTDLNTIRDQPINAPVNNHSDVCDSDNSDNDDLWGPITPEESCYLGTPLCHCQEDDNHR